MCPRVIGQIIYLSCKNLKISREINIKIYGIILHLFMKWLFSWNFCESKSSWFLTKISWKHCFSKTSYKLLRDDFTKYLPIQLDLNWFHGKKVCNFELLNQFHLISRKNDRQVGITYLISRSFEWNLMIDFTKNQIVWSFLICCNNWIHVKSWKLKSYCDWFHEWSQTLKNIKYILNQSFS